LLFNKFFFRLSIHALVAKIQPDKVARWRIIASCISSELCSTFQTCILNLH